MSLFEKLKAANQKDWHDYTHHRFVEELGAGSLSEKAFRHYLVQDYLFLIHFSRAYALAIYKADSLEMMRSAKNNLSMIMDTEMELHVGFCAKWGISRDEMEKAREDRPNMAYTRYVLERGMAGDLLDLLTALAPCVVGYGEIGKRLAAECNLDNNPYRSWVEEYASDGFQQATRTAIAQLDALAEEATPKRFERLARIFGDATRLEVGFWQMGLDAAS